jgi:hypothetical protein
MVEKLKSTWCCPTGDVVLNLRTSSTLAAGYNVIFIQWVWVIETWLLAVPEHEIQRANALANVMATEFISPSQQTSDRKIQFGSIEWHWSSCRDWRRTGCWVALIFILRLVQHQSPGSIDLHSEISRVPVTK